MKRFVVGVLMLGALEAGPTSAQTPSLWERRRVDSAFLWVDNRARRVGDLLTIVVSESTGIDHEEQRQFDKETNTNGKFNFAGLMSGNTTSHQASASLDSSLATQRQLNSTANFVGAHKFDDRMTVTVVEVLPNNNLVIEGFRKRIISGEERTLRVTGVVRPTDIGIGNIVESQFIANFEVTYKGRGEETAFGRQGWWGRIVNKVWPF